MRGAGSLPDPVFSEGLPSLCFDWRLATGDNGLGMLHGGVGSPRAQGAIMTGLLAFGMHTLTREILTLTPRSSLPCSAELAARKRRRGKILGKGLWGRGGYDQDEKG